MSIWDTIKDWFTKEEEYKFDEEKRAREEKELFDKLYGLDGELSKKEEEEYNKGLEVARPPKEEFVYQEIDDTTDDDIKNKVSGKYEKEDQNAKDIINTDFENKQAKENEKKELAEQLAKEKEQQAIKIRDKEQEEFKNKAIKSGIVESSIVGAKNEEFDDLASDKIEGITKEAQDKLKGIDGQIDYLNTLMKQTVAKHDNVMSAKVNSEIEKLMTQRDNLVKTQTEANKKTDYNKEKHEKNVINAEEKFKEQWQDNKLKRLEAEAKKGYTGERKDNYDKRLELAKNYLSQYPKEVAIQMIDKDDKLKTLMGNNLYLLRKSINDR